MTDAPRDYYALLEVDRRADADEIKRAYRRLALKYHPDRNPDDPQAEEHFKAISAAYTVLSDPGQRKRYDLFGHGGIEAPFGGKVPDFQTLADLFEGIFGEIVGGLKRRSGRDLRYTLEVTFEDAALGTNKTIEVPAADGEPRSFNVRVPAGVEDGAVRTLKGAGLPGPGGPGDLLVVIRVAKHERFSRKGATVYCDVVLTFPEAALGGTLPVPTLWGEVNMHIPPGTRAGSRLRLKGKGMPIFGGYGRGDQIVCTHIDVPQKFNSRQRELLEALRKELKVEGSRNKRPSFIDRLKTILD